MVEACAFPTQYERAKDAQGRIEQDDADQANDQEGEGLQCLLGNDPVIDLQDDHGHGQCEHIDTE